MTRASQFFRNVASNYAVNGIHAIVFILLTPFIVHHLGLEQYAVWVILQTVGYYLGFLDAGLPDAQVRQHTVLLKRHDLGGLSRLFGTVFVLYFGAGGIAMLVTFGIASLPTAQWLDIPTTEMEVYTPVLLLIGATAVFSFVERGLDCVFEGYQRYDIGNTIDITYKVITAFVVLALLQTGHGIVALAALTCAITALSSVTKLLAVWRLFPVEAFPSFKFDRASWQSIRRFSLWGSLSEIMSEGNANLDKLLIPIMLASAMVTPYSLVVTLAAAVYLLAEPITDTFLPISSLRHSVKDKRALTALLLRGTKLVTISTLPVAIVIVFFGRPILDLWVGAEYTDVSISVLWLSVGNFFFSTYLWTAWNIILGAGEIKRLFIFSFIEAVLLISLIVSLVPVLGLPGFALGGLLANVSTGVLFLIPAACRQTTLKPREFVFRSLLPPLLAAVPGCIVAFAFLHWLSPTSIFEVTLAVGVTMIASALPLFQFAATRWERARYYATFRRLVGVS